MALVREPFREVTCLEGLIFYSRVSCARLLRVRARPRFAERGHDPVGAYFCSNGDYFRAANHVTNHTGWGDVILKSPQDFADFGVCQGEHGELADGPLNAPRYHIRLRWIADTTFGNSIVGTPHYEVYVSGCGHAVRETVNGVSGFDIAKQRLLTTMGSAHYNRYEWWGNTQPQYQSCTGRWAASNGYVRAFSIPSSSH